MARTPERTRLMTTTKPEMAVFTTVPTPHQRERIQWRMAYVRLAFDDGTTGVVALATAPLTTTPDRVLRETAQTILQGMMYTYSALSTLGLYVVPDSYRDSDGMVKTSLVCLDSLANFERRHAVEYSALYLQLPFLERLGVAYEHIAKHTPQQCDNFNDALDAIYHAASQAASDVLAAEQATNKE